MPKRIREANLLACLLKAVLVLDEMQPRQHAMIAVSMQNGSQQLPGFTTAQEQASKLEGLQIACRV